MTFLITTGLIRQFLITIFLITTSLITTLLISHNNSAQDSKEGRRRSSATGFSISLQIYHLAMLEGHSDTNFSAAIGHSEAGGADFWCIGHSDGMVGDVGAGIGWAVDAEFPILRPKTLQDLSSTRKFRPKLGKIFDQMWLSCQMTTNKGLPDALVVLQVKSSFKPKPRLKSSIRS